MFLKKGMRAVTGNKDNSEEDQLSGAIGKEVNSEEDQLSEVIDAAAVMMPQNDQNRHHGDIAAVCTRDECVQKNVECDEWKRKYKELKRVYMKLMQHSTDRDMKYEDLLKLATTSKPLNTDEGASSEGGIFTPKEIKALGYVAPDKPKDSTFILECLQYAYKSDLSVLRQKTLKGYADWVEISEDGQEIHHPGKEGLTPEKVECIKKLFINRISNLHLDPVSFGERIKETNINKLFASGIKNISKKKLKGEN